MDISSPINITLYKTFYFRELFNHGMMFGPLLSFEVPNNILSKNYGTAFDTLKN